MKRCWDCKHHSVANQSIYAMGPEKHYCSHPDFYSPYAYREFSPRTEACDKFKPWKP